jgi:hypothetical protein
MTYTHNDATPLETSETYLELFPQFIIFDKRLGSNQPKWGKIIASTDYGCQIV